MKMYSVAKHVFLRAHPLRSKLSVQVFSSCEILSTCIYEFGFLLCSEMLITPYGVVMIK